METRNIVSLDDYRQKITQKEQLSPHRKALFESYGQEKETEGSANINERILKIRKKIESINLLMTQLSNSSSHKN